ncbi:MAG: hypothetical protein V4598_14005 [Bdellovibrionota bacterium]
MKKLIKYGLYLGILTSLTGCLPLILLSTLDNGHKKKKNSHSQNESIRRPLDTTQEDSAHFYRKRQMVTTYDCNGHVVSHEMKVVKKHLDKTFTIDYSGRKNAWSTVILNRRNGSQPVMPSRDKGQFTVDLSPTWNHIRVSKGLNEIEYVFYKCPQIVGTNCAVKPVVEKEGIFLLDISYEVIDLPGESAVRPSPGSCPAT